jgi:pyruvate/2-oxoglutarate dehydrogenase complex dihydrolipoamide acyltransferase (E2) component
LKVVAFALDRFPQFASSVDMANQAVIYKQYRHIGIAVDTPNGLLVPVIRDVDRKTISELAAELATISQKARDKKLSLDDMSGGVFTISNLGGIGGTAFTPLVNAPEVAILGVSRGSTEPVFTDGEFEAREAAAVEHPVMARTRLQMVALAVLRDVAAEIMCGLSLADAGNIVTLAFDRQKGRLGDF